MAEPLKRKFDQLDEGDSASPAWEQAPSPVRACPSPPDLTPLPILRRTPLKRAGRVAFDGVTVFYFPRCQGFTSVPGRGGCTLGMAPGHSACHRFSLAEFAQEQARARREKLRQRLKEEKLQVLRQKLLAAGAPEAQAGQPLTVDAIEDAAVEQDLAAAEAGGQLDEGAFLQPFPARQRRALLRAAGVRRVDREEKRELQALRRFRQDCGCRCDQVCDPETCSCSLAGIKCQMDHTAFPCGCCREGCANPEGRVEFNQVRVQTHLRHTLTRLRLERGAGLVELEVPAPGSPPPALPLGKPPAASELGADSCSSDASDSSTASSASGAGEAPGDPGRRPGADDDSLVRLLTFSDSDLGVEEGEGGGGRLDPLGCFHPSDVFGPGEPDGLAGWTHGYCGSGLTAGVLDENANLDTSCLLDGGLGGLRVGGLPGSPEPPGGDAPSSSVEPSLSSCDSFELLQALPDYSLGPRYSARRPPESPARPEVPLFPVPSPCPSGGSSPCFLESLLGFEPGADAPFDGQLFEDAGPANLEPVPV
ncbi:cysteine/serine-rich nuclear protein 1 [Dasypus novemcinctus]|uniref:cysteine/serine-rich nuclear protein 1 n=1 Tax=Dasypus novemcinctus TaxID=9361 RepID=UPI000328F9E1|nr:cysteine/serine-rich nuclear protein 1 [Dasypus novemcinctus]XP_058144824.1 cysteine/serine-rich nuclear protein 1 [Dasypus novemcinctus]XP_058144825.1 cysteine/serine-rich nuclear protein 1 [Dasypus novemcinctus]